MTEADIKTLLLELICDIAPEADAVSLRDQDDIREVFDLDSMDFANLIVAIHKRAGIEIPVADYNKLFTLKGAIAYVQDALAKATRRSQ
jgi:acyl carrier protein